MTTLLIITNSLPKGGSTAGNVFDEITDSIAETTEVKYLVVANFPESYFTKMQPSETFVVGSPIENWGDYLPARFLGEILAEYEANQISKKVQILLDEIKPNLVFLDIQSHPLLTIADKINFGASEVTTFMWDHWNWRYKDCHTSTRTQNRLNLARIRVYKKSKSIVVPSRQFGEYLSSIDESNKCKILVLPIPVKDVQAKPREPVKDVQVKPRVPVKNVQVKPRGGPAPSLNSNSKIIAFIGQPYAFSELMDLIEALKILNNSSNGLKVKLRLYGYYNLFDRSEFHYEFIENMGFFEPSALITELAHSDLTFLPFPFEVNETSELSFPSKLSIYLSAELPIIYYGPFTSPPGQVLYLAGNPCMMFTKSALNLSYLIEKFFNDFKIQRLAMEASHLLANDIFGRANFEANLLLLGCEPKIIKRNFLKEVRYASFLWRRPSHTWSLARRLKFVMKYLWKLYLLKNRIKRKVRVSARKFARIVFNLMVRARRFSQPKGGTSEDSWKVNGKVVTD